MLQALIRLKTDAILVIAGMILGSAIMASAMIHHRIQSKREADAVQLHPEPETRINPQVLMLERVAEPLQHREERRITFTLVPVQPIPAGRPIQVQVDATKTPQGTRETASVSPGLVIQEGRDTVGPSLAVQGLQGLQRPTWGAWAGWDTDRGPTLTVARAWGHVSVMVQATKHGGNVGVGFIF